MPIDLSNALDQIDQIRRQMVRGQLFRGYRAQTTAMTGALGIVLAALQPKLVSDPWAHMPTYFFLWGGLAIFCTTIFAAELIHRCRRLNSPLYTQRAIEAAERFIPSLVAGAILTAVFYRFITAQAWMLPGLWAMCFGLGIFASRTLLPGGMSAVGGYYLLAGAGALVFSREPIHAFSPWAMALTFGVGQLFAAAVLYWNLERPHARRQEQP